VLGRLLSHHFQSLGLSLDSLARGECETFPVTLRYEDSITSSRVAMLVVGSRAGRSKVGDIGTVGF
jgi:hypothetical protein